MKSRSESDAELPNLPEPTAEDVAALERAESYNRLGGNEYFRFLQELTKNLAASRRTNRDTDEPFEL
jgi:hypothetical protein